MENFKTSGVKDITETGFKSGKFHKTLDSLIEGIQILDFEWRYIYVNDTLTLHLKNSKQELIGSTLMEKFPGIERTEFFGALQLCMTEREPQQIESEFLLPDKSKRWLELRIEPIAEGLLILSLDITAHKEVEAKLKKANHLNAFISQINQNIVRVKSVAGLFHNACELAIAFGKFKVAWIGLFDHEDQNITLVEQSGIPDEELHYFSKVPYQNNGPLGYIVKNDSHYVCNDIENELELASWKPFAKKHSLQSCIVLPIKKGGKIIGSFNLYSGEINFSTQEEIALLVEVANDISYALDIFEKSKRHAEVEHLIIQNEKRFRALIDKNADMITLVKEDGELIYCSASVTKGLGYSLEELLHKQDNEFIHPEDLFQFREHIKKILSLPGESFSNQQRIRHKSGKWIWCEGTVTNMLQERGINALVSNFRDISERKLSEQKLKNSEAFNLGILNSLNSHIAVVNFSGTIIATNETWKRFGIENNAKSLKATGVGSNYFDVCANSSRTGLEEAAKVLQGLKDVMTGKIAGFYHEYPCNSPSEKRWFGMRIIKFESDETMAVVAHQNISERKLAEENLVQSEITLNEAQSTAHLGNWEMNFATQQVLWSDEACRIYGFLTTQNIQSYSECISLIHPEDREFVISATKQAQKTLADTNLNYRILLKDGSVKHIYAKSKFKFDQEGRSIGLHGIVLDVTDRKIAELEKEKMISDIIQHSKNLEQFAYIVSHNLRSPIANILGLASLLKANVSEADRKLSQDYLFVAVEKLDEIVLDLNKILQVRSGITENKEIIDLSLLVSNIELSIQNLIRKENVKIIVDFSSVNEISTLKSYIHSIFYNLISNSIKYRQSSIDPVINISTTLCKEKMRISFKDNGLGIDLKQNADKVFGLYKRFHLNKEGKGLGLFMTKTQVEVLGGTIAIESSPGHGTEFIIELPL